MNHSQNIDLSDPDERARLSGPAILAFLTLAANWKLDDEEARALLGVCEGKFAALKSGTHEPLDEGTLLRISNLVGIYRSLNTLHGPKLAAEWLMLPNANEMFNGSTPLDHLCANGIPAFRDLRKLMEARIQH